MIDLTSVFAPCQTPILPLVTGLAYIPTLRAHLSIILSTMLPILVLILYPAPRLVIGLLGGLLSRLVVKGCQNGHH